MLQSLNPRLQLITTAAVSSFAAVLATLALQSYWKSQNRQNRTKLVKKEAANSVHHQTLEKHGITKEYSDELVHEQLARNIAFLGPEGVDRIRKSTIVVVGAGGVGSWAATMLVRSGVGKLRIIDFDQVTLSSLNRHACATLGDVGTPKVHCVAEFLTKVAPWVEIEPIIALWDKDKTNLLDGATYVVDAIDNIDTKVDLLEYCVRAGIKVISSMGAGCKGDPTRIRLADLSMTIEDPLSRATRRRLKLRGVSTGIPVVFSAEKPGKDKAKLLELEDSEVEKGEVSELAVLQDFRVRILPVLGPLPAIFGLTLATHIIIDLGGYESVYDPIQGGYNVAGKQRTKLYDSMMQSLVGQCARMKWPEARNVTIDLNDVEFLIEEVWRGKSITGQTNRLLLTVWDPKGPVKLCNLVPVNKEQQTHHEREILKGGKSLEEVYPSEVISLVRKRFELQRWYENFR